MTTYIIMHRDYSDNDLTIPDKLVFICDRKYNADWELAGLEADASENDYYYCVTGEI